MTEVVKRSVTIAGHATSVSLEAPFWDELKRIAEREDRSLAALIADLDRERKGGNLSSRLRVYVLAQVKAEKPGEPGSTP